MRILRWVFGIKEEPKIRIRGLMRTLQVVVRLGRMARIQRMALITGGNPRIEFGLSTFTNIFGDPSNLMEIVYPVDSLILGELHGWLGCVNALSSEYNPALKIIQQGNGAVGFINPHTGDAFVLNFMEEPDDEDTEK